MKFGQWAESQAVKYLKQKRYEIITTNFYSRLGEIDIVAQRDNEYVFVEVKARKSRAFGNAEDSVSRKKINRLQKTMQIYLMEKNINLDYRLDLIVIEKNKNQYELRHFKNIMIDY